MYCLFQIDKSWIQLKKGNKCGGIDITNDWYKSSLCVTTYVRVQNQPFMFCTLKIMQWHEWILWTAGELENENELLNDYEFHEF